LIINNRGRGGGPPAPPPRGDNLEKGVVRGGGRETRRGWEKLGEGGRNSERVGETRRNWGRVSRTGRWWEWWEELKYI